MNPNARELLGLGRDDCWGYGAFGSLLATFLVSSAALVVILDLLGSGLLVLYVVRSTRRALRSQELSRIVIWVGLVVNAVALLLFAVLAFVRYKRLVG
jgi:hypothetical protein